MKNALLNTCFSPWRTLLNWLLIIGVLSVYSCKKEKGEYLLGDLINENPYLVNDIIRFQDSKNDTIEFKCYYRQSELYKSYDYHDYYYTNEKDNTRLTTNDSIFELSIFMASHFDRGSAMSIYLHDNTALTGEKCTVFANNVKLPLIENTPVNPAVLDSILIDNQYYYNVMLMEHLVADRCYENNEAILFYYNTTYGLIKIDYADSMTWELINE